MKFVAKKLKVSREENGKTVKHDVDTEVKQFESLSEIIQDAGSEEGVVKYVNSAMIADSGVSPRVFAGSKGAIALTEEELFAKVRDLRKNYSLSSAGRGISKADKVSFADLALAIDGDTTLTDEEKAMKLLALARSAKA